jgi:hypothetical protein
VILCMTYISPNRGVGSQDEIPILTIGENNCTVAGYQTYSLYKGNGKISLKNLDNRRIKYQIIRPYINALPKNYHIMDLGCSSGSNGLQAIADGYKKITFVDHDYEYIDLVRKVLNYSEIEGASVVCSKFSDLNLSVDVTIAFALIHWLYASTEEYKQLGKIIDQFYMISPNVLFIEWIDPEDSAVLSMRKRNKSYPKNGYSKKEFIDLLSAKYSNVILLGSVSATREVYLASQSKIRPLLFYMFCSKCVTYYWTLRKHLALIKKIVISGLFII